MDPGPDFDALRAAMVAHQLAGRGIRSPAVLHALGRVPRERFVPGPLAERAYEDRPLPIGDGQTISQPYMVAWMLEALELAGGERVLEIGTGSGYAAAALAEIADAVFTIERNAVLAREAARRLAREGYADIHVRHGDGTLGWPEAAPFDAIVVAAGGPSVPPALSAQLAPGGRLVVPIGTHVEHQQLVRVRRVDDEAFTVEELGDVRFVPLVGRQGWAGEDDARP